MKHPSMYQGKDVVVLGLARSGVAVAKLFHEAGAKVTVNDKKERSLCPEADELEALGISVICGYHPDSLLSPDVSLLVKNPGIPYSIPPIREAERLGIEIVTEVEVASYICKAPIIGITGSNGKTTTTIWVGQILEQAGMRPIIAGNIGRALCEAALEADEDNWMVTELSSFQLKGTNHFRPRVACLLNVSETHLDYHGSMEDYIHSKAKLFANLQQEDTAVFNWDDIECRQIGLRSSARLLPFSSRERLEQGVYLEPPLPDQAEPVTAVQRLVYRSAEAGCLEIMPADQLGTPGRHNAENALAAVAIAIAAGAPFEALLRPLKEFHGVEHRLEFVCEKEGVAYYNNSKATNSQAANTALRSFSRPVVLIAGGQDRGSDFRDMLPFMRKHVKGIVALGETRQRFADLAREAGIDAVETIGDTGSPAEAVEQAVRAASRIARAGDVVLLSPACASWDMFESYEIRGSMFKQSVHKL